jgi:hypothetical protein
VTLQPPLRELLRTPDCYEAEFRGV